MTNETKKKHKAHVVFRDDEIDLYTEAQHHALDRHISVTEYIKEALIEKNLKSRVANIANIAQSK